MTAQALIALAEAHAARSERAALERRLAATRPRAAAIGAGLAVLAGPAPRVAGMTIRDLLVALYGVGHDPRRDVLDVTRVDPATALGGPSRVDDRRRPTRALAGLVGPRPRQHGGPPAHDRRSAGWRARGARRGRRRSRTRRDPDDQEPPCAP